MFLLLSKAAKKVVSAILLYSCALSIVQATTEIPIETRSRDLTLQTVLATTLENNLGIRISREDEVQQTGNVIQREGEFDFTFRSSFQYQEQSTPLSAANRALSPGNAVSDTETGRLSLSGIQPLRNGWQLSNTYTWMRDRSPLSQAATQNTGQIEFAVKIPLLRGGFNTASAPLRAAYEQEKAQYYDFQFQTGREVLKAIQAYWAYLARYEEYRILSRSYEEKIKLVENVNELIQEDERPRSDIWQAESRLYERESELLGAEQTLIEASHALAETMGLSFEDYGKIPLPADTFPSSESIIAMQQQDLNPDLSVVPSQRADIKQVRSLMKAREILLSSARNLALPKLDVSLSVGYNGLREGSEMRAFYGSINNDLAGPNMGITIEADWPMRNRSARGQILTARSQLKQTKLQAEQLGRSALSEASLAWRAIEETFARFQIAQQRSDRLKLSYEGEREKFALGDSTMIDVLNIEESHLNSLIEVVRSKSRYQKAIALYYERAGAIVDFGNDGVASVDLDKLLLLED